MPYSNVKSPQNPPHARALVFIRTAPGQLKDARRRERLRVWLEQELTAWFGPR